VTPASYLPEQEEREAERLLHETVQGEVYRVHTCHIVWGPQDLPRDTDQQTDRLTCMYIYIYTAQGVMGREEGDR
jgi:hypothetical protein